MRTKKQSRIRDWVNERRPKSRTKGVKAFSIIFTLTILGGAGYATWWAWEEVQSTPEDPHAYERQLAQACFDKKVDGLRVQTWIDSIENENNRNIAQYHFDGFKIALEHEEMLNGGGRYATAEQYCHELQEFLDSLEPEENN